MINNENQNDVYLDCSTTWSRDLVAVKWGLKQPRLLFPCEEFERRFASLASSGLWSFGLGQQQAAYESRLWTCDMEAKLRRGKPTSSGAGRTLWESRWSALSPARSNNRWTNRVHMPLRTFKVERYFHAAVVTALEPHYSAKWRSVGTLCPATTSGFEFRGKSLLLKCNNRVKKMRRPHVLFNLTSYLIFPEY